MNAFAVLYGIAMTVNLAWPRASVYGSDHWYYQWGAFVFVGLLGGVGALYYLIAQRGRPTTVLAEHRSGLAPAAGLGAAADEA